MKEMTREEYCAYDSAITNECWQTLKNNQSNYCKKLHETLNILIVNQKPLPINNKKLKSIIQELEDQKPLVTPKQALIDMKYLKSSDKYAPWKLHKYYNVAKTNEDKLLIKRHIDWIEKNQALLLYKKLNDPYNNHRYINELIDFQFLLTNSGMNPVTWRCSSSDILSKVIKSKNTKINQHLITDYFDIEDQDLLSFEMLWKEDIDRNFKLILGKSKSEIEKTFATKYPTIEAQKLEIMINIDKTFKVPWSDHTFKYTIIDENKIYQDLFNQSLSETLCDNTEDKKNPIIIGDTIMELEYES